MGLFQKERQEVEEKTKMIQIFRQSIEYPPASIDHAQCFGFDHISKQPHNGC